MEAVAGIYFFALGWLFCWLWEHRSESGWKWMGGGDER